MTNKRKYGERTLEVHAGEERADPVTGARATPIYYTSSYAFESAEKAKKLYALEEEGHIYTRISNPTTEVLEKRVAAIENGVGALAQSTGMSAILLAILNIANAGDEIVASNNLYGGTYTLFKNTMVNWGIKVNFVDTHDLDAYREAINDKTKAIYCESVGNPQLDIPDFEAIAEIAHENGIPLIVDNTSAITMVRPIDYGADIVVHSATKFLSGTGTSMGGIIVDGGNFDWTNGKFPQFTEPDESYHGFFYSGITPSATGGQPVQLYYMNKDGNRGSDSTVVLMTVAVAYKFVLVVMGLGILLFWLNPLRQELGNYFPLYLLGLALNVILVILILGVMLFPKVILKLALLFEGLFIRLKIWKPSEKREEKINGFIDSYQQAVTWLKDHKGSLLVVIFVTFLQRCSVFVLTYMVYLGFGLQGSGAMKVILLQAAVYIAVDMLPLPGAQGITELMYQAVFVHVFTGAYLIPSMLVSRGINFYFLLIVSLAIVLINRFVFDRRKTVKTVRA